MRVLVAEGGRGERGRGERGIFIRVIYAVAWAQLQTDARALWYFFSPQRHTWRCASPYLQADETAPSSQRCRYVQKGMYVCFYLSIFECMNESMYVCMYVCTYACMYVCTYVCMYVCMYRKTCIYVCMYAFMHKLHKFCSLQITLTCIRMHVHAYSQYLKKRGPRHFT
jgi:hypothetical protein